MLKRLAVVVSIAAGLLNETQIASGPPMQLHATPVTEGMRVQLRETGPTAEGLDELPDPLAGHAPLLSSAASRAISHDKHRLSAVARGPFLREVVGRPPSPGARCRFRSLQRHHRVRRLAESPAGTR